MTTPQPPQEPTMEVIDVPSTALQRRSAVVLAPVMNVEEAKARLAVLQAFCDEYLVESKDGGNDGGDYGPIPGAGKKKVLFKSGAEKLCDVYSLADRYTILAKVEDFSTGLFDYTVECDLSRKDDDSFVGSGLGSCNSFEAKYRWRTANRQCPICHLETIIKGREEFGGGWLCFRKKGGCGAKFMETDSRITAQLVGRVQNEDIADVKNTVLAMACKRAKNKAVIAATRSSGMFSPDEPREADVKSHTAPPADVDDQLPEQGERGLTAVAAIAKMMGISAEAGAAISAQGPQQAPTPDWPSPAEAAEAQRQTLETAFNAPGEFITHAQQSELFRVLNNRGHKEMTFRLYLKLRYHVEATKDIRRSDYAAILGDILSVGPLPLTGTAPEAGS